MHKELELSNQIPPKELQAKKEKYFKREFIKTLALVSNCLILSCGEKDKSLQLSPFLSHAVMVGQKWL